MSLTTDTLVRPPAFPLHVFSTSPLPLKIISATSLNPKTHSPILEINNSCFSPEQSACAYSIHRHHSMHSAKRVSNTKTLARRVCVRARNAINTPVNGSLNAKTLRKSDVPRGTLRELLARKRPSRGCCSKADRAPVGRGCGLEKPSGVWCCMTCGEFYWG